jgi:hypothetical protein
MRELTVTRLVIEGVKPTLKAEMPSLFSKQSITVITTEF